MNKEDNIKAIVENIAEEINDKDFLTYRERDEWERYLTNIIDIIIEQENKQLKEKNLNAVSDYENEKSKNQKALEYITNEKSIETFKTIDSREEWLKVNHKLLEILK